MLGHTDSFLLAVVAGGAFMLLAGIVFERVVIRLYYDRPKEDQILVTFGVGILIVEAVRFIFGGLSQRVPLPDWGEGIVRIGFMFYPKYRLEVIFIVALALFLLYLVLYRTRIGLIVRAGIEDATMVNMLGINVRRAFMLVFAVGVLAAGFAGMVYAPLVSVDPDMGENFLAESFVVIVIGGLGSFPGAVAGGLIAGEIISLTSAFNPDYSYVMLYAVMALLLVVQPQGLFGTEGRA